MKYLTVLLLFLASCSSRGSSLDDVTQEAISKKEGVDIRITPVSPEK